MTSSYPNAWLHLLTTEAPSMTKSLLARIRRSRIRLDAGMTTAEYAVGTVAAVAFASVLFKVVQSPQVRAALSHIVTSALNVSL
jgi:hypothetical protein